MFMTINNDFQCRDMNFNSCLIEKLKIRTVHRVWVYIAWWNIFLIRLFAGDCHFTQHCIVIIWHQWRPQLVTTAATRSEPHPRPISWKNIRSAHNQLLMMWLLQCLRSLTCHCDTMNSGARWWWKRVIVHKRHITGRWIKHFNSIFAW